MWNSQIAMQAAVERCKEDRLTLQDAKSVLVREWIADTLKKAGNNQSEVAEREGVHRNTVSRIIKHCGIEHKRTWKNRKTV